MAGIYIRIKEGLGVMADFSYSNLEDSEVYEDVLPELMHFADSPVDALRNPDQYDSAGGFLGESSFNDGDTVLHPNDWISGSSEEFELGRSIIGAADNVVVTYPNREDHKVMSSEHAAEIYEGIIFEEDNTLHVYGGFEYSELPKGVLENHMFAVVDEVQGSTRDISDLKSYLFSSFVEQDKLENSLTGEQYLSPYRMWGKGDGENGIKAVKDFLKQEEI